MIEVSLDQRHRKIVGLEDPLKSRQKEKVLQHLAHYMMSKKIVSIGKSDLINIINEQLKVISFIK